MQTVIHKTPRFSAKDSVVFAITDFRHPDEKIFSADEIRYIRQQNRENKKKVFAFNRLNRWVFVVFVDKGKDESARHENYRSAGARLLNAINENKLHKVVIADTEDKPSEILAFAEGMALANYQFLKYRNNPAENMNSLNSISIVSKSIHEKDVDLINITLDAVSRCRNLINEPVASLNAVKLSDEMETCGKQAGIRVEVLNKKKIETLKMGGLLAVNKGSLDPPTFTIMEWKPEKPVNSKPYVLVGKGVVFDTGGLNIKTSDFMNNMKSDMSGAAAVGMAVYAIAKAKLPIYVVALIPATDNRPGNNAYVNGDIITMHDGTKVEVINTDAEGRLILADALSYAKKYDPKLVINVATLTGSAQRAIGKYGIVAMQSKAENEIRLLKKSGERIYERIVEFPFWKEYEELIKSDVGDIKNVGGAQGGAITAGKFLEHFTNYPFIHLDIAGPAFAEKSYGYYPAGGTGFTVRLLFHFLMQKTVKRA
jgi:leucyl aminopeptidase